MKKLNFKIILLISFIISMVSCKAQTLPLNTLMENIPNNAHVKDLYNELNPYIGIYKANYQGNEITLFITKEEDRPVVYTDQNFYRDALVVKYIVKNSSGIILQDTQNVNNLNVRFYSTGTNQSKNRVDFNYSGTNCRVGGGLVYLKKINPTQISWDYQPQEERDVNCPPGTDTTVYLPAVDNLIFTKQ